MSASVSGEIRGVTSSSATRADSSPTTARSTCSWPVAWAPVSRSRQSSSSLNARRRPAGPPPWSPGSPAASRSPASRWAASATAAVTSYSISSVASQAYLAGSRPPGTGRGPGSARAPGSPPRRPRRPRRRPGWPADRARNTCQSIRAPGPRRSRPSASVAGSAGRRNRCPARRAPGTAPRRVPRARRRAARPRRPARWRARRPGAPPGRRGPRWTAPGGSARRTGRLHLHLAEQPDVDRHPRRDPVPGRPAAPPRTACGTSAPSAARRAEQLDDRAVVPLGHELRVDVEAEHARAQPAVARDPSQVQVAPATSPATM